MLNTHQKSNEFEFEFGHDKEVRGGSRVGIRMMSVWGFWR